MYFPDLESIRGLAEDMNKHIGLKKYTGIIPTKDTELPQAREELARYLRDIWQDEISAMEVELAVDKDNYEKKMQDSIRIKFTNFFDLNK